MANLLTISIAGVNIRVHSSIPFSEAVDLSYRSFLSPLHSKSAPDISIEVHPLNGRRAYEIPKIFDSGDAWSMHRQNDEYFISYNRPSAKNPFWIARCNDAFSHITLFWNTHLSGNSQGGGILSNPIRYPIDQIILMYFLARHGGILVHASGIAFNQKGYIFSGKSGAGKSTIAQQFIAKDYHELLSDDRVIVRETEHSFTVYGTPWPGKGGIAKNVHIPLSGIFFLRHSRKNVIEPIDARSALEKFLPVASIPWYDPNRMGEILETCGKLLTAVPAYMLHFRPDTDVVDAFEEFLSGRVRV